MAVYELTEKHYETAALRGIERNNVYQRVYNGWTIKRAITQPLKVPKPWDLWKDVAEANGVTYETFRKRVYKGWGHEKAAKTPLLRKGTK